jgi:CHRD domain
VIADIGGHARRAVATRNEEVDGMPRNSNLRLGLIGLAVVALAVPALALAGKNTVVTTAKLQGKNEVPGPGDRNGKGAVEVSLKAKKKKVCFALELQRLDLVTAGHIHKGTADEAGPIKVTLFEDAQGLEADPGSYDGCVKKVKKKLVRKIGKKPEKYYVNVHNPEYPEGAIRGQLKLATAP